MSTVLATLGDYYHCSDQLLEAIRATTLPEGAGPFVLRYPDVPDRSAFTRHELIIFAMMGRLRPNESDAHWMDEPAQQTLADHVAAGAGLLVLHSGTASHPTNGPLRALVGGHFVQHPPEHPEVTITPVADHPVTRGVDSFSHPDEHYFMDLDDDITPLLRATSVLGDQPAGWCREHGEGRVAVIVPGHTREMLEEPMLHRLLSNASAWLVKEGN